MLLLFPSVQGLFALCSLPRSIPSLTHVYREQYQSLRIIVPERLLFRLYLKSADTDVLHNANRNRVLALPEDSKRAGERIQMALEYCMWGQ